MLQASKPRISYGLLLGDFIPYVALYVFAVVRHPNERCLLGSIIAIPSFILWFVARLQLGSSFTVTAQARELVTHGLYSRIRNPIYFFSTLALLGIAICLHYLYFYIYVGIAIVPQLWRIRREQQVLQDKFGQTYLEYKRRTWF
jgi:protein-S-isoprenylcysteine O-methyltransferase Ste14